ncbi:MAG: carbohydrate-binding domain-containing protein [Prevotella sp.]|nr:carbohydrate-binding domain-containing protein [Prevotella sp.]
MKKTLLPILALAASINSAMAIDDNTVEVTFSGSTATVEIASNISSYITNNSSGSHVKLVQSESFAGNSTGQIIYVLTGSSTDGEFYLEGSYKCEVDLNGLTLSNPSGPAINIQNGKRIDVSVKKGTTNTLSDGANEDYNGCFHCKGHTEFKGKGTLNIVGNSKHAIYSKEYVEVKNCTINITSAVKDGIHCKEYFLMESGTINISGIQDDGIQVEQDTNSTVTSQTTGHEDENSGNFYLEDGTLTIAVYDYGGYHVKADGSLIYGGGTYNYTTTATGINNIQASEANTEVFDLNGRRVNATQAKGLHIVRQAGKAIKIIVR